MKYIIIALIFVSCKGEPVDQKEVDKIVYHFTGPALPNTFESSITATDGELLVTMEADTKLEKKYPFSSQQFEELKASLEGLYRKGKAKQDCDGGIAESLALYKGEEKFFVAIDYSCGGAKGRDYAGADIDLRRLIPDYKKLEQQVYVDEEEEN